MQKVNFECDDGYVQCSIDSNLCLMLSNFDLSNSVYIPGVEVRDILDGIQMYRNYMHFHNYVKTWKGGYTLFHYTFKEYASGFQLDELSNVTGTWPKYTGFLSNKFLKWVALEVDENEQLIYHLMVHNGDTNLGNHTIADLDYACGTNNFPYALWVYSCLTKQYDSEHISKALVNIAKNIPANNNVEILSWLFSKLPPMNSEYINNIYYTACITGSYDVVKWLDQNYTNVITNKSHVLQYTCYTVQQLKTPKVYVGVSLLVLSSILFYVLS